MSPEPEKIDYDHHKDERARYSQLVIDSTATKKLVMAGPGTGKSFLFQEISRKLVAEGKEKILVLTFINELVRDLSIDMHGLANVSTLHSFAAKELRSRQNIYLHLLKVVETDIKAEKSVEAEFDSILHNLKISGNEENLAYLENRRKYYGAYDTSSIVFELVKLYENDETKIPLYDIILIDEYQDFNELEARLIELLASKSDVVIAGDDDQSLYSFKHAKPESIRQMHRSEEYKNFELPYCSRSTQVIIDSYQDFLNVAKSNGHLDKRINKQYLYFVDKEKDSLSSLYPKIEIKTKVYSTRIAYLIDRGIQNISVTDAKFDVLIICSLKKQIEPLANALRKKGYINVSGDEGSDENTVLSDGLRILHDDKESNLGWRLCAQSLLSEDEFNEAVNQSSDCETKFIDCVPAVVKAKIKKLRAIVEKILKNQDINKEDEMLIFSELGVDPSTLGKDTIRDKIFKSGSNNDVHKATRIKITHILKSKGLSYDYVFMVNFDDRYLLHRGSINDERIHNFLVALTRSRKKIFVYTSKQSEPTFVSWVGDDKKQVSEA